MARITTRIILDEFTVKTLNEKHGDEPYLWPFFVRIDGRDIAAKKVLLSAPGGGHGDLGPIPGGAMTALHLHQPIPPAIGRFETTLETDLSFTVIPKLMKAGCFVTVGMVFLEQDASRDIDIVNAHTAVVKEVQAQLDQQLQAVLGGGTPAPLDEDAIKGVVRKVFIERLGTSAALSAIPVVGLVLGGAGLGSLVDPDDFVGLGVSAAFDIAALIGNNPAGIEFTLVSQGVPDEKEGRYQVSGRIQRIDTDEVPLLAAVRRQETLVDVYTRTANDTLNLFHSADLGRNFTDKNRFLKEGFFRDGPAACTTPDGSIQHLFGRGLDNTFWRASSVKGSPWQGWSQVPVLPTMTFKSAPAAAVTADGQHLHLVGRGDDDRYFHAHSADGGKSWTSWKPIGQGVFHSSPAMVISPDGSQLFVFGLGNDQQPWYAVSSSHGALWNVAWKHVQVNKTAGSSVDFFTSAPAAAISADGQHVTVVCRTKDNTYWRTTSAGSNGFMGYWQPIGKKTFFSAPAVVTSPDGGTLCVLGLGDDLRVWRSVVVEGVFNRGWESLVPKEGVGSLTSAMNY